MKNYEIIYEEFFNNYKKKKNVKKLLILKFYFCQMSGFMNVRKYTIPKASKICNSMSYLADGRSSRQ